MAPRNESSQDWQVEYSEIQMRTAHLLSSREWADCTFQFQPGAGAGGSKDSLDAHRLILAMASPVFAVMFYGDVGDKENPVIISDIDFPTFSALLEYIYTDDVDISDADAALSLYKAANKYILVHLEKMCLDYLYDNLNPDNVCDLYEFSCFFGEDKLKEQCLEMFSTKTQCVLKGRSFQNAHYNTLKRIVLMDTLDISSEMDLFNAMLDYVDHLEIPDIPENLTGQSSKVIDMEHEKDDKQTNNNSETSKNIVLQSSTKKLEEARKHLQGIIEEIRFLSMDATELAKICENTALLSKEEMCAIFTNKFSPNSKVPMPEGFSCLSEPRIRGAATFRFTVHNVKDMPVNEKLFSPPCYVRSLPWKIVVERKPCKSKFGMVIEALNVYLHCNGQTLATGWSCYTKGRLSILSDTEPIVQFFETTFSQKKEYSDFEEFISWQKLENTYIKEDSFTLEMHLIAEPVQGILIWLKRNTHALATERQNQNT